MRKKSILEVYSLCVCFFALLCFVIAVGTITANLLAIKYPSFTMSSWTYHEFDSNETYCASLSKTNGCEKLTQDEIAKKRQSAYQAELVDEHRNGLKGLVNSFIVLIISLATFLPHWCMGRKARECKENPAS